MHRVAHLLDDPDELVAKHRALLEPGHLALDEVEVGAADPGRGDLQDGVGGLEDLGSRAVLEADPPLSGVDDGLHGRSLLMPQTDTRARYASNAGLRFSAKAVTPSLASSVWPNW